MILKLISHATEDGIINWMEKWPTDKVHKDTQGAGKLDIGLSGLPHGFTLGIVLSFKCTT